MEPAARGEHAFIRPVPRRAGAWWRVTKTAEQKIGVQFAVRPAQRSVHSCPRQAPLRCIVNNNTARLRGPFGGRLQAPSNLQAGLHTEARTPPPRALARAHVPLSLLAVTLLGAEPRRALGRQAQPLPRPPASSLSALVVSRKPTKSLLPLVGPSLSLSF